MELSNMYRHSNAALNRWSPTGRHVVSYLTGRLIVRSLPDCAVEANWSMPDPPAYVEWDSAGDSVLCANYAKGIVQAWSLSCPNWGCTINESLFGLAAARWSPDGNFILTFAENQLRITIWSFDSKIRYIPSPKYTDRGYGFSKNGLFFAVAFRREMKDYIIIFSTSDWKIVSQFHAETFDLDDLCWSANDEFICIRDSRLEYKLCLYTIDGKLHFKFAAYEKLLGIKSMAPSPAIGLIAVGSFDQKVRVLNCLNGGVVFEGEHRTLMTGSQARRGQFCRFFSIDIWFSSANKVIPGAKLNPRSVENSYGVNHVSWSYDSRYLMTRNENMPTTIWIWDVSRLQLHSVLIFKKSVGTTLWTQTDHRLCVSTSNDYIYIWSPDAISIIPVPSDSFTIENLSWSPKGNALLVSDKKRFAFAFDPSVI